MKTKLLTIGASLVFFAAISPASANLIVNGSFEAPSVGSADAPSGSFTTLFGGSTNIGSWTVTGNTDNSVDWINGYWQAQDGTHSIDLNGTSLGGVEQTISTVLGQHYLLTFWLSGNPDLSGGTRTLDVSAGASTVPFQYVMTGSNGKTSMLWEQESLNFTGTGSPMVISFVSTTSSNCCFGPALDNVSVSAVPELSTWIMMLIGFAGVGSLAYRRAKKQAASFSAV
jgi:choice-of-anchor C domain-containing protein